MADSSKKQKTMAMAEAKATATATLYLPDEYWENVVKFLVDDPLSLESLSLVSKQLLFITNSFKFSLTISNQNLSPNSFLLLQRLFHRFPNITSLHLMCFRKLDLDSHNLLDALLCRISEYPFSQLKSLKLSNPSRIPSKGFEALSKKHQTSLKSLICSKIVSLNHTDLKHIAKCFPFLEQLCLILVDYPDIYFIEHRDHRKFNLGIEDLSLALPNLRELSLSGNKDMRNSSLLSLFKNCVFLEKVVVYSSKSLTSDGIASAIRERLNLKSLFICPYNRKIKDIDNSQLINSLLSLEDLNYVHLCHLRISNGMLSSITKKALPWRKLVLRGCYDFTYDEIFSLLCKCQFLQHLDLHNVSFLNDQHVADLSLIIGKLLVHINVSACRELTDSAMFSLIRNCPLLGEIRMGSTGIGKCNIVKDFDYVNAHHRVKSLYLACNPWLKDESIQFFASIFPNLELLDLSFCGGISDQGVVEVLRRCLKIRHLTLKSNTTLRLLGMNFQVPKLEVLNMSGTCIGDETLYVISKSCSGLLQLELKYCSVTEIGVRLVIENCTKLRKINLSCCLLVTADAVAWMLNSRPSPREISALRNFLPSHMEEKYEHMVWSERDDHWRNMGLCESL